MAKLVVCSSNIKDGLDQNINIQIKVGMSISNEGFLEIHLPHSMNICQKLLCGRRLNFQLNAYTV